MTPCHMLTSTTQNHSSTTGYSIYHSHAKPSRSKTPSPCVALHKNRYHSLASLDGLAGSTNFVSITMLSCSIVSSFRASNDFNASSAFVSFFEKTPIPIHRRMPTHSLVSRPISLSHPHTSYGTSNRLTLHTIRTQHMRPLLPATRTALIQRRDIFQMLPRRQLPVAFLHMRGLLFGDGVEETIPEVA